MRLSEYCLTSFNLSELGYCSAKAASIYRSWIRKSSTVKRRDKIENFRIKNQVISTSKETK